MLIKDEASLMTYSEELIYEIQDILKSKPELLHYTVLKKAMDIEEYLYCDALVKTRLNSNDAHVWQSRDSIREYQISAEKLLRQLREREGDWVKLFNVSEIRHFMFQVYQDYIPGKKIEKKTVSSMSNKKVNFAKKTIGKKTKAKASSSKTVVSAPTRLLEVPSVTLSDLPPRVVASPALPSLPKQHERLDAFEDENHDQYYSQEMSTAAFENMSNANLGHMSEDASELLNSMFDVDDANIEETAFGSDAGNVFSLNPITASDINESYSSSQSYAPMFRSNSAFDLKSSLSSALLSGMSNVDDDTDQAQEDNSTKVRDNSLLPSVAPQAVVTAKNAAPTKTAEEERIARLNDQRELERKQRQELKSVNQIDKSRKYLLFGEGDDDDDDI